MISAAFFWPMPWMYWSAIRTRLLVGIFTPAIRATDFSPVADPSRTGPCSLLTRAGVRKREHDARPLRFFGARHRLNYPTWMRGLLMDSSRFRQPSLSLSSLFRDLFHGLFGSLFGGLFAHFLGGFLGNLPGALFALLGRFCGLGSGFGAL